MPGEMAVEDEVGHDRLQQPRALPVGEMARRGERPHQILGQDGVAEPQRREQQFAEGAEIDHPAGPVEPLQRRQHARGLLELAFVIVLDDPGAAGFGPGEQGPAPRQRHRHAQRTGATAWCRRAAAGRPVRAPRR